MAGEGRTLLPTCSREIMTQPLNPLGNPDQPQVEVDRTMATLTAVSGSIAFKGITYPLGVSQLIAAQ